MDDITKIIKSYEESGLLTNSVKAIKNEVKEQKGGFLGMLLSTLGASLLRNPLTGKGFKRSKVPGRRVMRAGEGTIRASEGTDRSGQYF